MSSAIFCTTGEHGGHIGNVVDERGEEHAGPHNDRINHKEVAPAQLGDERGQLINDPLFCNAANHQEQAQQQQNGVQVNFLQGLGHGLHALSA